MLAEELAGDALLIELSERLSAGRCPLAVSGLWGSSAPLVAGALAAQSGRPLLYVTAHPEQADEAADDLESLCGVRPEILPAWELRPGEGAASDEIAAERTRVCESLRGGASAGTAIVAPVQALMQAVPTPAALDAHARELATGQSLSPTALAAWLVEHQFTRLDQVEQPGDFAVRGDIVDVFVSAGVDPVRVEFLGDEIESLRRFDPLTQRSTAELKRVRIVVPPQAERAAPRETTTFFDYLAAETVVAIRETPDVQEMGRTLVNRLGDARGMYTVEAVFRTAARFRMVHLTRFDTAAAGPEDSLSAPTQSLPPFEPRAADAVQQVLELSRRQRVIVYCANDGERQRLGELLEQVAAAGTGSQGGASPWPIEARIGVIHEGFGWRVTGESDGTGGTSAGVLVIGHQELFHRYQRRRRMRPVGAARPIESFLDLSEGDYVVHATHGIARFAGMKTLHKSDAGKTEEFLALQFAGGAVLHVPASQIDLVQKYVGPGAARPALSALGGTRWKAAKARVEEAVTDFAAELLRVQAEREAREGVAFPADTKWQREFEAAFPYVETPDQTSASAAIKADLTRPRPMDRLLCGDVGYGKTELAMRSAFKAAEFGKQVAVLVPTTVLAEQHYETFRQRMAEYPFVVERLSRFRSAREQSDILARTRKGHIDVLIGTHRLLSGDVRFADLGLVIIDEEQRFGVEHKERLKHLRSTVDVLTLTATPIPRTLHMSMVGLRDISALETPPLDRRSIATQVVHWDDRLIREAVLREINRDGQVFFVHNRVKTIERVRARLAAIVPEARIVIGHGQMHGDELEDVMLRFIRKQADILLCTSIIESGIDIPSANTIFIDRADMFGLADLHQLRGRVGRYKHRAYCYLVLSPDRPLTSTAARRLKAIEEFSELGSGFRIAMRDLEIRGAGNILGAEQSGHIAAVGYEMYCRLLEQAVRRMKGETVEAAPDVHLELNFEAYVPRSFVASERQRMEIYRRVTACRTPGDVEQLERDVRDAYGAPPPQLETLLALADLRIRAGPWKVRAVIRKEPDLIFTVEDIRLAEKMFKGSGGSVRMADGRTLHWRVPDSYFSPATLLAVLRRLFSRVDASV